MRRILSSALLVVVSTLLVEAQTTSTTRLIPYAGSALDAAGSPLAGLIGVTFELYEEQDGGAPLWRETQRVQTDERGRYLVYLGAVTPIPQIAFTEERARWLAVSVEGRALARVMLVAVPYALRAADADTLGGQPASSFVRSRAERRADASAAVASAPVDGTGTAGQLAKFVGATAVGSSIVTESGANQLGIGTTDPTEGGLLNSRVTVRATDGTTALAVSNQAGLPRFALNTNSDGSWITYDRATGVYQPGIAQRGGRVGVATTDPTGGGVVDSKFTVRNLDNNTGIAVLNQANARRFALNTLANGSWTLFDGANGTWNAGLSQLAGRIGIGGIGSAKLHVDSIGSASSDAVFARTAQGLAVTGWATMSAGRGVFGHNDANGIGVLGTSDTGIGVEGRVHTSGGIGVLGVGGVLAGQFIGNVSVTGSIGVGTITPDARIRVESTTVEGIRSTQNTAGSHAIRGIAPSGSVAIVGIASDSIADSGIVTAGVNGVADTLFSSGVLGSNTVGYGVYGTATTGVGVRAQSFGAGLAGEFIGNVTVTGTLSKGGGSFTIDHPLDPANKYLRHSFVESPDMMNVYNGNVTLDVDGAAWVTLPEWFEALNRDFRYQLTAIGAPGPNLHVASEVSGNRFRIAGGPASGRVSWQVTGIRQDAWANAHRISVEEDKPAGERGAYLHPKEHGQSETARKIGTGAASETAAGPPKQ